MSKASARSAGNNAAGSVLKGLGRFFLGLIKLLMKAIILLGLWVPILYALFGLILHLTLGFEPFDFSMFSTFYIVGGIVCIVIVVIISAYNVFINPLKKAKDRKRAARDAVARELQPPLREEKSKKRLFGRDKTVIKASPSISPSLSSDYSDAQSLDWLPPQERPTTTEHPDIYFSTLKPDILVHEYSDRFELFRVEGDKLVSIGTEFK